MKTILKFTSIIIAALTIYILFMEEERPYLEYTVVDATQIGSMIRKDNDYLKRYCHIFPYQSIGKDEYNYLTKILEFYHMSDKPISQHVYIDPDGKIYVYESTGGDSGLPESCDFSGAQRK